MADYQKNAALFVSVLLHSGTNAHFMHLQSKSYSQHKALGRYYEDGNSQDRQQRWNQPAKHSFLSKKPHDWLKKRKWPKNLINQPMN